MLYIILGIIMVFLAWMQAAYGKMQKFKNEARTQWVRIDSLLQTRSRYVLQLLETAGDYGLDAADLLAELFDLGGGYCKSDDREVISAQAEAATPLIDKLLALAGRSLDIKDDPAYLEIKNTLQEVEEEIELQSERYNHSIDLYNRHIETPSLRLQFSLLGAPHLKGIHIR
ncbi:MAG: LemA family [Bacillota bacterium]|jgi:hypothetical protein|nr:LemA family [Bacillota bacterium]